MKVWTDPPLLTSRPAPAAKAFMGLVRAIEGEIPQ